MKNNGAGTNLKSKFQNLKLPGHSAAIIRLLKIPI